jgi:hypothetical protein
MMSGPPANKCYASGSLSDSSRSNLGGAAIYGARVGLQYLGFNHTQEVL